MKHLLVTKRQNSHHLDDELDRNVHEQPSPTSTPTQTRSETV